MSSFLDIEKIVTDWAWDKYKHNATRKQQKLYDKQNKHDEPYISVKIDWSGCEFTDHTSWCKLHDDEDEEKKETTQVDANHTDKTPKGATAMASATEAAPEVGNRPCVLFKTEFTNNTKSPQTYTMNIQKTTRSTCETEIETGITKGFELGVTLKMPCEILEMNAGYHQEVSLTKTSGQSFEEELQWGATSEIVVQQDTIAEAQLLVREKKQSGSFTVTTRIKGYVGATFCNLRDNNSFLKRSDGDISFVVNKFLTKRRKLGEEYPFITVNEDEGVVIVTTKGCSHFRFGVKQEVKVDQRPVNSKKITK